MYKKYSFTLFFQLLLSMTWAQHTPRPNISAPNNIEVNIKTGNLFHQRTDLIIPGRGISTDLTFSYNTSLDTLDFGYGKGWTFTYNMQYEAFASSIILLRPDGRQDSFLLSGNTYLSPVGVFDQLSEYDSGKFRLRSKQGMYYYFDDASHKKLTKIEDPNGNALTLSYTNGLLSGLDNPSGRSLDFTYTDGHLTQITDLSISPNRII